MPSGVQVDVSASVTLLVFCWFTFGHHWP